MRCFVLVVYSSFITGTWWRHQMETFSALLALCAGNSPVTGEFRAQRPVTQSFDVFFDVPWINAWVDDGEASDLRRHRVHYDVIVMIHNSFYRIIPILVAFLEMTHLTHPQLRMSRDIPCQGQWWPNLQSYKCITALQWVDHKILLYGLNKYPWFTAVTF